MRTLLRLVLVAVFSVWSVGLTTLPLYAHASQSDDRLENKAEKQVSPMVTSTSVDADAVGDVSIAEHTVSLLGSMANFDTMAQSTGPAGELYLTWHDNRDGGVALYFTRSLDGGKTFSSPIRLDRASGAGTVIEGASRLLSDVHGNLVAIFSDSRHVADGQIYATTSRDKGASFSDVVRIDANALLVTPFPDDHDIAAIMDNAGNVYVAWEDWRNDPAPADGTFLANIFFTRSTDFGATWEASVLVDDDVAGSYEFDPLLVMGRNGSLTAAWLSTRAGVGGNQDLMYSSSTDFGTTWSADARINATAAGSQEMDEHVLCSDGAGFVYAFWMGSAIGFPTGNAYVRTSTDYGKTFSNAVVTLPLSADGDKSSGNCVLTNDGIRAAVFAYSGGPVAGDTDNLLGTVSSDGGLTWSSPVKLNISDPVPFGDIDDVATAIDRDGNALVTWKDDRAGQYGGYANWSSDYGNNWNATDVRFTNGAEATTETYLVSQDPGSRSGVAGNDRGIFQQFWHSNVVGGVGIYYSNFNFENAQTGTTRAAGSNRYNTAIESSKLMHQADGSASAVIFATGEKFPDGLAATTLSSYLNAPILLVKQDSISSETLSEFTRVFDGIDDTAPDAYIIGGGAAIGAAVEAAIAGAEANVDVKRLSGADRKATSVLVAKELDLLRGFGPSEALIARADEFPDALTAGAVGGNPSRNGQLMPVLLTDSGALDPGVAAYIGSHTPGTLTGVHIVGGTAAVSDDVAGTLGAIMGGAVYRHAGSDRYATATQMARDFMDALYSPDGPLQPVAFGLATGENFADALGGGAYAAQQLMPLLLTKQGTLPTATHDYVVDNAATITTGTLFGGTAAVSQAVQDYVNALY